MLYSAIFQVAILGLNVVQILMYENVYDISTKLLPSTQHPLMIPFDVTILNMFLILQTSVVDYIGRNELDRAQYFTLRILPFVSIFIDQVTTSKPYPPFYKSYICALVLF